VVKIDEFAVFPMLYLLSFGNNIDIVVHYDNNLFWISLTPITMTLNDLECPIHLKVCLTDGTLDLHMLWLLELTINVTE